GRGRRGVRRPGRAGEKRHLPGPRHGARQRGRHPSAHDPHRQRRRGPEHAARRNTGHALRHRGRIDLVSGVSELIAKLATHGLDLVAPFPHGEPPRLAFVIGNSRALWPHFLDWLAADRARAESEHPLETYVELALTSATESLPCTVEYAHAGPPWPPIQRLAERAGLAWLAPSPLAVHPVLGPWLPLRAIVVPRLPPPPAPAAAPACPACSAACLPAFERARATLDASDPTGSMRAAWRLWL